jgi:hypothetical protein
MGKKKKEIRIIRKDSIKQDYTFISNDNILNNTKNNESTNNEKKPENNLMRELKKRFTQRK